MKLDRVIAMRMKAHLSYKVLQQIPGIGPVTAAIFIAEIGDVSRFPSPKQLSSWAGLTPRHRESDMTVHRGPITKQGSYLVRWATIEAVCRQSNTPIVAAIITRVGERRGKKIARVAAARKLLTLVYYAMRDNEVRCLASKAG